ncbi:hypothetical protein SDJN03_21295, partial [Cucurbita argyrosperma subsp. sororia]
MLDIRVGWPTLVQKPQPRSPRPRSNSCSPVRVKLVLLVDSSNDARSSVLHVLGVCPAPSRDSSCQFISTQLAAQCRLNLAP